MSTHTHTIGVKRLLNQIFGQKLIYSQNKVNIHLEQPDQMKPNPFPLKKKKLDVLLTSIQFISFRGFQMGIVNVVGYAAQVEKCYECNYLENIVFEVKLYDTYDTPSPWADDKNGPCTVTCQRGLCITLFHTYTILHFNFYIKSNITWKLFARVLTLFIVKVCSLKSLSFDLRFT